MTRPEEIAAARPEPAAPAVSGDLIGRLDAISLLPESAWSAVEAWMVAETCREAIAEINRASADVARLTLENEKLNAGMVGATYCAYCGYRVELDDMAASGVSEHIRTCQKHPMREVEAERDTALADVARLQKDAGIARVVREMNNEAHHTTINKLNAARAALAAAVAEEREACAEICDHFSTCEGIAQKCADAIRTRAAKEGS